MPAWWAMAATARRMRRVGRTALPPPPDRLHGAGNGRARCAVPPPAVAHAPVAAGILPQRSVCAAAAAGNLYALPPAPRAVRAGTADIGDALAGAISGRVVRGDDDAVVFYAADAGPFEARPAAAAVPRDEDEAAAAVRIAADLGVPVTARGGGTGLAGGAVGTGIVLDMRLLDGIEVDAGGAGAGGPASVAAGAGAPKGAIDGMLGERGLFLGPNPSVGPYCTAGGMVATNAAGSRSLKYGSVVDNLLAVRIVDGLGRVADLPADAGLSARIAAAARGGAGSPADGFPATEKNSCGYRIDAVGSAADAHRALAGSEGTLGIVLSARLRAAALPDSRRLCVVACGSPADAAADCLALRAASPSALEYVDGRTLSRMGRAGGGGGGVEAGPLDGAACALLAEFDEPPAAGSGGGPPEERHLGSLRGTVAARTSDEAEMRRWWRMRDTALSGTLREGGGRGSQAPPAYVVEDAAVPPARVGRLLALIAELEERFGLRATVYGHIGSGNLHVRLSGGDGDDYGGVGDRWPDGRPRMRRIAEWYLGRVVAMGGTITGEHGDGLARTWLVARQYAAPARRRFAALKALLDPLGILNPGKIVPAPAGRRADP